MAGLLYRPFVSRLFNVSSSYDSTIRARRHTARATMRAGDQCCLRRHCRNAHSPQSCLLGAFAQASSPSPLPFRHTIRPSLLRACPLLRLRACQCLPHRHRHRHRLRLCHQQDPSLFTAACRLFSRNDRSHNPSHPRTRLEPGQAAWRPPHSTTCASARRRQRANTGAG